MCPKDFVIILYTFVYTIDIPTLVGISQRQHVFRVYVIHSNCTRLHNFFFFMIDYGENSYLHWGWNKDVLGRKKLLGTRE